MTANKVIALQDSTYIIMVVGGGGGWVGELFDGIPADAPSLLVIIRAIW